MKYESWLQSLHEGLLMFWEWLFSIDRLVMFATVIGLYFLAAWLTRWVDRKLPDHRNPKIDTFWEEIGLRIIRRLAFPVIYLILLGVPILLYQIQQIPAIPLTTAAYLTLAWGVIRLGSIVIKNPAISAMVSGIVWAIAALNITGYGETVKQSLDSIEVLSSEGRDSLSIYDLVVSAVSVAAFVWIALFVAGQVEKYLQKNPSVSPSARALLVKLFRFCLLGIALLMGLNAVGINLTAFAVFGGAIAVGIGLGLQKVFSNIIAGVILLSDKSIKPGDTIVAAGRYGEVNKLSARYVSMITRDGKEYLIPNDELINSKVENWSHSDNNVRLKLPLGVHYNSDLDNAMAICLEAAADTDRVLLYPKPACLIKGFGDNSVDLELRFWINDPMNGCSNVKSIVYLAIWHRFKAAGIEIPYPQRDLHIVTGESL